jgi:hypothetical protein
MDAAVGSLDALLELAAQDEAAGLGESPWPPHFRRWPERRPRGAVAPGGREDEEGGGAAGEDAAHRRRKLDEEGRGARGLERWKARHPAVAAHLAADDVLVDSMRGGRRRGRGFASASATCPRSSAPAGNAGSGR